MSRPPLATVRGFPAEAGPLDLDIRPHDIILVEGPNGAGKSSLLRALAGLPAPLRPERAELEGDEPAALPATDLRKSVAWATQDPRDALVGLTVEGEFSLRDAMPPENLNALAGRDVATLSSGEARRVGLEVARVTGGPLLLLDEPVEGLDEARRAALRALVRETGAQGGAVVLVDHARVLSDLATRRVMLGASSNAAAFPPLPPKRPETTAVLIAPARQVARGGRRIDLPALEVGDGVHALTGPNGCGKTTLLHRLAGLLDSEGVTINGRAPAPGQNARLLPARARDLLRHETVADELAHAASSVVDALVPEELRVRHPFALSGGETQRVALAKTLGRPAECYLLDEPEAHLDAQGRDALARVLRERSESSCVVVATHDATLAAWANTRLEVGP